MDLTTKEAIFFDLDGTLIDSVPDLETAINLMLTHIGRSPVNEEILRDWVGNGSQILVKRALLGKHDVENETLDQRFFEAAHSIFLNAYETHLCNKTTLYPHVLDTLRYLMNKGYRLAVITNKPHRFVYPIISRLGMDGLFRSFLGGDALPKKKPDPMPLLHMCDMMELAPEQCIFVGDSGTDMRAASAAQIDAVAVRYGYHSGENLNDYAPLALIDDFGTLAELF